ncbi:MAG: DUF2788 domain-containing protein [Methylophilaceae bacterium]
MQGTIFGLTEAQISEYGVTYGVAGLMLLMLFIVGHLAWESKAGKFGTLILFIGLALGMAGYVAKYIIKSNIGL